MVNKKFEILGSELADAGFYITLPECTDRQKNIEKQKKKFSIKNLHKVSAETDPHHQSSCTKSHRKVFEIAKKKGYDCIAVFEDDFQLHEYVYVYNKKINKNLKEFLVEFSEHLKNVEWDILLLGFNGRKVTIPYSKYLTTSYVSTGAWGYLIKKRAYEYILDNFNYSRDLLAIDNIIPEMNYHGFKSYASTVQIVHHGVGFVSTLSPNGPVDYTYWIEGNYHKTVWSENSESEKNFDDCLNEIYKNSEDQRNRIIKIINFDGNSEKLEELIDKNEELKKFFILVEDNNFSETEMRKINYYFKSEFKNLFHLENFCNLEKINSAKNIQIINYNDLF